MRYSKTINIHALNAAQIKQLQPGQWVTTSDPADVTSRGIFLGVKPSGSVVVAWYMNAKAQRSGLGFRAYVKTLRNYATAR